MTDSAAAALNGWLRSRELAEVAHSWLLTGATAFGVWHDEQPVAVWPPADAAASIAAQSGPPISAPMAGVGPGIVLRVYGTTELSAQARLNADASLLGRVAETDAELEAMASDLVESQDQLVALYDLMQSTRDLLSVDAVLASVTREAARLTRAAAAFAIIADAEMPCIVQHPSAALESDVILGLLASAVQSGRPVLHVTASDEVLLPPGIASVLVAVMGIGGERRAALGLIGRPERPFTSPDLKLLRTLADQASARVENVLLHAAAIERARLDAEMQVARRVQMRLLPTSTPTVSGLQAWARSRPALEVGGDFFDMIRRQDDSFVMAVGDVSGKGMPAALLMAMTRTVLRGMARFVPLIRSEAMLTRANDDLYDDFSEVDMFATAFVAIYEPATREVTYANAGHAPVIYCPATGTPRLLEASSPPLGVLPTSQIVAERLTLEPGDVLVAATDGFNEASSPDGELFGYERLMDTVQHLAGGTATEIGAGLFAAVEAYSSGRPQDDDQTVVVLKGAAKDLGAAEDVPT